jgi:hypothetical protein
MMVTITCHAPCHKPGESSAIISIYRYQLSLLMYIVQSDFRVNSDKLSGLALTQVIRKGHVALLGKKKNTYIFCR